MNFFHADRFSGSASIGVRCGRLGGLDLGLRWSTTTTTTTTDLRPGREATGSESERAIGEEDGMPSPRDQRTFLSGHLSLSVCRLPSDHDLDIEDGPKMQPSSSCSQSDRMLFGLALRACIPFVIVGKETFHSHGYIPKTSLGRHLRTNSIADASLIRTGNNMAAIARIWPLAGVGRPREFKRPPYPTVFALGNRVLGTTPEGA
jgi:hypothetical protein